MEREFKTHYHGTTIDRLASIEHKGTLPMYKQDTGLTGAWTTTILENSIRHSRKRGAQRGGIEPIILKFHLPSRWVQENNDRKIVDSQGYDENVYCFKKTIPKKYLTEIIYPNKY
jgi:hypothetical protein